MMFKDQWVKDCCWSNMEYISGSIRGGVVSFHGLGAAIRQGGTELDLALAEKDIRTVVPYYGPWSWMNRVWSGN